MQVKGGRETDEATRLALVLTIDKILYFKLTKINNN